MIYTHTVTLRNGVPIKVHSKELPTLSEQDLLHIETPSGEHYTFVIDSVAYFTTRAGE